MTDYSLKELKIMGQLEAQTMLIGLALAVSVKDMDDPRGVLKSELSELEESFPQTFSNLAHLIPREQFEVIINSLQEEVLSVARLADSWLIRMGFDPASTREPDPED